MCFIIIPHRCEEKKKEQKNIYSPVSYSHFLLFSPTAVSDSSPRTTMTANRKSRILVCPGTGPGRAVPQDIADISCSVSTCLTTRYRFPRLGIHRTRVAMHNLKKRPHTDKLRTLSPITHRTFAAVRRRWPSHARRGATPYYFRITGAALVPIDDPS